MLKTKISLIADLSESSIHELSLSSINPFRSREALVETTLLWSFIDATRAQALLAIDLRTGCERFESDTCVLVARGLISLHTEDQHPRTRGLAPYVFIIGSDFVATNVSDGWSCRIPGMVDRVLGLVAREVFFVFGRVEGIGGAAGDADDFEAFRSSTPSLDSEIELRSAARPGR